MNLKFPNYRVVESLCPWAQDNTNSAYVASFADTVDVCADPASHLLLQHGPQMVWHACKTYSAQCSFAIIL